MAAPAGISCAICGRADPIPVATWLVSDDDVHTKGHQDCIRKVAGTVLDMLGEILSPAKSHMRMSEAYPEKNYLLTEVNEAHSSNAVSPLKQIFFRRIVEKVESQCLEPFPSLISRAGEIAYTALGILFLREAEKQLTSIETLINMAAFHEAVRMQIEVTREAAAGVEAAHT